MVNAPVPMSAPDISEADIAAVTEVMRSGRLSLGPATADFEASVAKVAGVRHAVSMSSGTAALHVAVRALGVSDGDVVLVPSFTFAASVNAILFERASPMFVDVDEDTYNVDRGDLETKVSSRTRGIMCVDVFGHPADWDAVMDIARRHDLVVIDDACEAIGARYRGRPLGSFASATTFAFYPNKQLTTGEGGVLVTDDEELVRTARSLRNQGRADMGAWLEHERLGFNYRMDEMSAALGLSQIRRLPDILQKRQTVAEWYEELLKPHDWVRPPVVRSDVKMSWFVYVVTLEAGIDRAAVMRAMAADGVPTRAYFSPIHLQPYIRELFGDLRGSLPVTESIASRTLALPFHNNLTAAQAERVVQSLARAMDEVVRSG